MARAPRACVASAYTANECCAYTQLAPGLSINEAASSRMSLLPLPRVNQDTGTFSRCESADLSAAPFPSG